ncbi:uncharacterized protein LOC144638689 isoform X1 [Oculina patagonica]
MNKLVLFCCLVLCTKALDLSDKALLEQASVDENKKQADSNPVSMEKFLINGEEFGPEDVEFDSVEDPTDAGPVIDGQPEGDEMHEPARDQALYGWTKHPFSWCTVQGRAEISRDVNNPIDFRECQRRCEARPGCKAIEFWEKYNYACFVCTDTSKITPYTNQADLAYPAHVWVQNPAPPTTEPPFDPCNPGSYKELNTYDRLVGNSDQSSVLCDQRDLALPGWYRFTGEAGDHIPTKCPSTLRCGTHAPGWLNGAHPSVADGVVTREVCYHWTNNCCQWKNDIKVKNCGAFYVYELQRPPACSLRYCGEPSECSDQGHQDLDQADRAMGNADQSNVKCDGRAPDNIVSPNWYRMTGESGDQIPEACVPMRRCGTHAPGWLDGQHPSVKEGEVIRQVCYHWSSNCCNWKNNIAIRNCGDFYVYKLEKPPACSLRYCGNKQAPTTQPPTTLPPTTTPPPDECSSYQVLNSADRAQGNDLQNDVRCDQRDLPGPGWYRFEGAAGDRIPDTCVPMRRCGTHAPGWIDGNHPTEAEGIVTRKVCYHWSDNCCNWHNDIRIKNCGAYFVYELQKTPVCSLRYCGNAGAAPTTLPPTTTPPPDECSSYQVLNSADRAQGNDLQNDVRCDQRDLPGPGWYRFEGAAGDRIPDTCVPMRRCGTHAPGWIDGNHPTEAEGIVTRKVCYHWSNNCCNWHNDIRIKNCGAYFVYELQKTPVCSLRYCGNAGAAPTTQPPTTTPPPDECSSYQVLNSADRAQGNDLQNDVRCDQRDLPGPGWYRFEGAAGDRIPDTCVPMRRCGTHAPGWIDGNHPTEAEGIVTRKVCYHWSDNCCNWHNDIRIKNCGAYFVYELQKTPVCSLRYCGNAGAASTTQPPTTLPPTTTPPPDECSSYQVLNSADRAQGNDLQNDVRCDQRDLPGPGWYRFEGAAGDRIPDTCVPMRRCGTHAPGWIDGNHPTEAEGIVTRKVCYHWSNNCCNWHNDIRIKNCGAYFVYELQKTPVCSLRYCGNAGAAPTTLPPTTTPPPDECSSYQVLNSADRAQGNDLQNDVRCDQRDLPGPGWYRFEGAAGDRMPDTCVPMRRCGTHAPGWIDGNHPTEAEGIVTRKVCYHWSDNCCNWHNDIRIKNCGAYFVYELQKTPVCSLRYCGNAGAGTTTSEPTRPVTTPSHPVSTPSHPEVNVTCLKDEMLISIPKNLLHGLDREHLRLTDVNCGATETPTHFILHTRLTECHTTSRHTKDFVCYMNKVEEIPVEHHQIITRVREVEIPFSCYYSNMGVVSAVGLEVKSKKIIFSKKGYGEFVLEMKIFPNSQFIGDYKKKDFPVYVPLRKMLFVEVSVDTEDSRLEILAEECFATPDPDPNKAGLKYTFIEDGCATDDTVKFIPAADKRTQRFSLEAFKFLGDHQFVYMHCKVKICNATDPNSRCAQGCLADRRKRSLYTQETNDEEYNLAQGPFIRKEEDDESQLQETEKDLRSVENKGQSIYVTVASVAVAAVCLMGISYFIYARKKRSGSRVYRPLTVPAECR